MSRQAVKQATGYFGKTRDRDPPEMNSDEYKNGTIFVVGTYVLLGYALKGWRHLVRRGVYLSGKDIYTALQRRILTLAFRLPSVQRKIEAEMGKAGKEIEASLVPKGPNVTRNLVLPLEGRSLESIEKEMQKMDEELGGADHWNGGKLSGAVYHGGDDMENVIMAAMKRYAVSNPLHPDVFPGVRKMEAEIVSMCLRMYNSTTGAGTTTSGGTESILMAVKAHRDWARDIKGIVEPELVVPKSAHAAFHKAGAYFKVAVREVEIDPLTRKVDLRGVKRAINANTIMIVGSAINFPDGNMDDITALGRLAKRYNIGLHVDCCLGSFIMPYLEKAGYKVEPFDFRVEGVTSISCDTHKYGFAPKGSSVIMYHSPELRRYQYYIFPDWMGGVYGSPSIGGSRPGSIIAGTWAAMQYMGQEGYLNSARSIVGCARKIAEGIRREIPELYILGNPPASVIAFAAKPTESFNALQVGDIMKTKGWHLNGLSNPPACHIACTRLTVPMAEQFISDLKESVREAKLESQSPAAKKGNLVTLYGLGNSSAVGPSLVGQVAGLYLDAMYKA